MSARIRFEPAQALQLGGVIAAVVLAAVVNVLSARHFRRWDWTHDQRWSLSSATLETLQGLEQTVDVWAIAGAADPLEQSLRPLLTAYRAATPRIEVHWIDPDRDAAKLIDLQRRFGLEAGRAEDGRVATDAIVVVAAGEKHWFLTPPDMFEPSDDDQRAKPREERALTQAVRSVLAGDKAQLCFTMGHGELSLDPVKDEHEWLGGLRDLLQKSNYDLASVDTGAPDARDPFDGCSVVVLAGPRLPLPADEANRLRAWLLQGGSLFAAVGPTEASTETGMAPAGLDAVLAPFGIALDDDLVHDLEPSRSIPETHGEGFFASVKPHPVTAGLTSADANARPPRVALFFTRSMRPLALLAAPDAAPAADLLVTGPDAYAKTSLVGAADWTEAPERSESDKLGPFVLAMAAERPRIGPAATHGPRVVVVGSRFVLAEDNWRQPRALHGTAFFVDSAISWLASRPAVIDIPDRAEVSAGMRVSEQGRAEVRRYVIVLMPLAAALLAVAVWSWRRSTENKPYEPKARGARSS